MVELDVAPKVGNSLGILHGGVALCAAELAGSAALNTTGAPLATASVHILYLRPTPGGEHAVFRAEVVHRGRSFGVARVVGSAASGKPCTVTTVTASSG